MASTTKKSSKKTKPRLRRPKVKTSLTEQAQAIAELRQQLDARNRQLTEALEQQTATSEILRVIASSPTKLQSVLDVVAENAARLCEANDATIARIDGNTYIHQQSNRRGRRAHVLRGPNVLARADRVIR